MYIYTYYIILLHSISCCVCVCVQGTRRIFQRAQNSKHIDVYHVSYGLTTILLKNSLGYVCVIKKIYINI